MAVENHYFFTIVDDYNRATWVYLMKFKSQVSHIVPQFYQFIQTQFYAKIKCIRIDNAPEFFMPTFYATYGVLHHISRPYTPQ